MVEMLEAEKYAPKREKRRADFSDVNNQCNLRNSMMKVSDVMCAPHSLFASLTTLSRRRSIFVARTRDSFAFCHRKYQYLYSRQCALA
mmetsp:Transcript_10805/g.25053  ORF Transcript_10805/g.25053 Transcript_10805/m.25053 type:complete len:88 (-) Transcript_10805:110-373(-)